MTLEELAREYALSLRKRDSQTTKYAIDNFRRVNTLIVNEIKAILNSKFYRDASSKEFAIIELLRQRNTTERIRRSISTYIDNIIDETEKSREQEIQRGIDEATAMILADLKRIGAVAYYASFTQGYSEEAVRQLFISIHSGKFEGLLSALTAASTSKINETILKALIMGLGPDDIINEIQDIASTTVSEAVKISTSMINQSYRDAQIATYMKHDRLIKGWIWFAHLDFRTCVACIAMHGTFHDLTEPMNPHFHCRCIAIPQTRSYAELGLGSDDSEIQIDSGKDWFDSQSQATQLAIMGKPKLEAYKAGKFEFDKLAVKRSYDGKGTYTVKATNSELGLGR